MYVYIFFFRESSTFSFLFNQYLKKDDAFEIIQYYIYREKYIRYTYIYTRRYTLHVGTYYFNVKFFMVGIFIV